MSFSQILNSISGNGSTYHVTVDNTWAQGRATFGGLVSAVGNEALRQLVPRDRPLRSLQTTFVGPAAAGTWQINARVLRVGKAVTIAQCEVVDAGQVAATVAAVYGAARASAAKVLRETVVPSVTAEECREVAFKEGMPLFVQHFAQRWAKGARPFSSAPRTPTMCYFRHRDNVPHLTESHVIALVDAIPSPSIAMFSAPAPASSLVWTLDFFEHRFDFPAEAWWRIDTDIDVAGDGYVNQTGVLHDPDGKPVALSRQLFAVFG
jgi:acyl-CoA thioesterase